MELRQGLEAPGAVFSIMELKTRFRTQEMLTADRWH